MSDVNKKAEWCSECNEETTFYRAAPADPFRCSLCESPAPVKARGEIERDGQKRSELPEHAGEAPWTASVPPEGNELTRELDHLRIDLKGAWANADLKGLLEDFAEIKKTAAECQRGLELYVTAVKKSAVSKARERGGLVIPFRDRRGDIIPGRALHLPA